MTGFRSRFERGVAQTLICLLAFVHVLMIFPNQPAAAAPSTSVVIDEVQVGGGNQEFIKLFNKGPARDISNWELVKYAESGENATTVKTFPSSPPTMINSEDFLLLAHANYSNDNVDPDIEFNASLAPDNTILLQNNTGEIIDAIRFGSAQTPEGVTAEGSAAANPPNGQSLRRNGAHTDTDDNAVDFTVVSTPTPKGTIPNKPVLNPAEIGDKKITVHWNKVPNARNYSVSHKKANEAEYSHTDETTNNSKTITGLENGATYSIQVIAQNRNGKSQPAFQTAEPAEVIEASIVYVRDNKPATHFGGGIVTAEVDIASGDEITSEDKPVIMFHRPNSNVVRGPLVYDKEKDKWIASLFVTKATTPAQDGKVDVELATEKPGKKFAVKTGKSFTVDTVVTKPTARIESRCSTAADSFTAAIPDQDVERIYIYQTPPTAQTNPIAVAPVVNGKTDEVFIGDNKVEKLYLVAQDKTGNVSDPIEIINDIRGTEPQLQLEAKDNQILATWPKLNDATAYMLRFRPIGQKEWQEKTITDTNYTIDAPNGKEYEVAVASRDTACNQSAFTLRKATARSQAGLAANGRGGAAENEARILNAAYSTGEKDSISKDQEPQKEPTGRKSTLPESEDKNDNGILDKGEGEGANGIKDGEEDRDGNGIKDGEEDKDGNGIKDGEEDKNNNGIPDGQEDRNGLGEQVSPTPNPSPSPEEDGNGFFQDRSRVIIALAILLIVAGTALAAYSWYRGDETPPSDAGPDDTTNGDNDHVTDEESVESEDKSTTEESEKEQGRRHSGKSRRKTRW